MYVLEYRYTRVPVFNSCYRYSLLQYPGMYCNIGNAGYWHSQHVHTGTGNIYGCHHANHRTRVPRYSSMYAVHASPVRKHWQGSSASKYTCTPHNKTQRASGTRIACDSKPSLYRDNSSRPRTIQSGRKGYWSKNSYWGRYSQVAWGGVTPAKLLLRVSSDSSHSRCQARLQVAKEPPVLVCCRPNRYFSSQHNIEGTGGVALHLCIIEVTLYCMSVYVLLGTRAYTRHAPLKHKQEVNNRSQFRFFFTVSTPYKSATELGAQVANLTHDDATLE